MIAAEPRYYCARCGLRRARVGACDRDGEAVMPIGPLLGTDVGNYVLVELLGEGGMGGVYRAVHPVIGSEVAIKILHASAVGRAKLARRFLAEAQAVNRVRHPGLVKIVDTGELAGERPYLVMELLDGMSLLGAIGELSAAVACRVVADAADALDAVHREGIIHRDLKPANIFLTREGRVVVLDFGIAKVVDAPSATTELIGTPGYMAPEQIRSQPLDRRTDVYALGIVLYEAVTRRRPFGSAPTFDVLVQHVEELPRAPDELVPGLAPELSAAIMRAIAKHPDDRYATAGELAAALRAVPGKVASATDVARVVEAHATAPGTPPRERETRRIPTRGRLVQRTRAVGDGRGADKVEAPTRRGSRARWLAPIALVAVAGAGAAIWSARRSPAPDVPGVAGPGLVEIKSNPAGATITIDHVPRGTAPLTVELPPGAHYLHAEHPGRVSLDDAIEIRAGERASVMLVLPERVGSATTAEPPPKATIVRAPVQPTTPRRRGSGATPVRVDEPPAEPPADPPLGSTPTDTRSPVTGRERKANPFP